MTEIWKGNQQKEEWNDTGSSSERQEGGWKNTLNSEGKIKLPERSWALLCSNEVIIQTSVQLWLQFPQETPTFLMQQVIEDLIFLKICAQPSLGNRSLRSSREVIDRKWTGQFSPLHENCGKEKVSEEGGVWTRRRESVGIWEQTPSRLQRFSK